MSAGDAVRWAKAVMGAVALVSAQMAGAAVVNWGQWSFDHEVSGEFDGLGLKNVTFKGRTLLFKINMPVLRVFYRDNVCGPYADRLGGTLSPIPWADNALMVQREFSLNGKQWYEIGIRDQIGNYDLYQAYYLSEDGVLDAHLYSKGLQCVADHVHYPSWRIDFDVDGPANNVIERSTGTAYLSHPVEFDSNATVALNHGWRVRNAITNLYVDLLPGFSGFTIPAGAILAVTDFSQNTFFGRVYKAAEDTSWTYGPNTLVPFNEGENLIGADIVAWYEAYMPHAALDGSELWHSTGIRLVSSLTDTAPPSAPANLIATAVSSSQVNLIWSGSVDDVGVAGYPVERCQGASCTDFAPLATATGTSFIDSGLAASTAYRYRVRAVDAAGNSSTASNPAAAATPSATPLCTVTQEFRSISDDKVEYRFVNTGATMATLDTLTLSFPAPYVAIKEIRVGKTDIFKSSSSVPPVASGVTIGAWTNADASKRELNPGSGKNLEFVFSKKSPKSQCPGGNCFSGRATFAPGCQIGIEP